MDKFVRLQYVRISDLGYPYYASEGMLQLLYVVVFFITYLIFSPRTLYQAPPSSALVLMGVVITVQNQAEWTWFREPVLGNKGTSLY